MVVYRVGRRRIAPIYDWSTKGLMMKDGNVDDEFAEEDNDMLMGNFLKHV